MNNKLIGFQKIRQHILARFQNNKLHHGLLFSGIKGIGKTSFTFNLAQEIILSSSNNCNEDLHKIQSGFHPNLLTIAKDDKKQNITIDTVRQINKFLNLSAAISKHRVIIIDAVDDLNNNSSNALLKILEEPPKNVFLFLINHNKTKLLDTIKSRCQTINIPNPSYEDFTIVLKNNIPEIDDKEIKILAKITNNSIGTALKMENNNTANLYQQIQDLILANNNKAIFDLAKKISSNNDLWDIFEKLIIFYFYNLLHPSHSLQNKLQPNYNSIFIIIDKVNALFFATNNLNLDKSQSIINIFNMIKNAKN